MDEHDKHDDPAPGVPDPNPLAQALIDNPGLVPHLLNWIEDQTPNPDTSLDNGARLIIWKMGKEYEGQNPPAYLHLMELAQNREPDITRMDVATLRAVLAATYACAIAMSCSDPAHYGVTLPERKKIHVRQTNCQVPNTARASRHPPDGSARRPRHTIYARVAASPAPCSRPHMAKVQVMPCQRPPSSMVIARLTYGMTLVRLPGREK